MGGGCTYSKTTPCQTCPWRLSSTIGGEDIPNFSADMMRALRNTVGRGDDFRPIMACHYSDEEGAPCIGYLAVEGYSNLAVRIMTFEGRLPLAEIMGACDDLELFGSFEEMLETYEEVWAEQGTD